jgi:hypothetical protein
MGENNCRKREQRSTVETQDLGRLAREPKKKLKLPGAPVGALGGKGTENGPETAVFCHFSTETGIYPGEIMRGSDWVAVCKSFPSYPIGSAQKYAAQLPQAT